MKWSDVSVRLESSALKAMQEIPPLTFENTARPLAEATIAMLKKNLAHPDRAIIVLDMQQGIHDEIITEVSITECIPQVTYELQVDLDKLKNL